MKNLKNVPEWNLSDFYSSPKDKKISLEIKNIEKASEKFSKDFVNEIIYNENKKAVSTFVTEENNKPNKEILTEPNIFIRKWIGEVIFKF